MWRTLLRLAPVLFAALSGAAANAQDADYRLEAGDVVRIVVRGETELSGDYRIDPQGRIYFPLIGALQASGISLTELKQRLTSKLRPDYLLDPVLDARLAGSPDGNGPAVRTSSRPSRAGSAGQQYRVVARSLRVRREASRSSAVVGGLMRNNIVTVLNEADGWCDVRLVDSLGRTLLRGWVARQFLEPAG